MPKTIEKVTDATATVRPYVDRAMHDKELRESLQNAWTAARDIYDELIAPRSGRSIALRAATDKEIQDNLRTALEELRHAADRLQAAKAPARKSRNATLLVAGIALGILFNPMTGSDTRRWLRERLSGGGEAAHGEASSGNGTGR